jgi:hypothetical protein
MRWDPPSGVIIGFAANSPAAVLESTSSLLPLHNHQTSLLMAISLLQLAPELLFQILASIPVKPLLKFSQCSRYAHSLANASLHTLKLDFGPKPNSFKMGSHMSTRRLNSYDASKGEQYYSQPGSSFMTETVPTSLDKVLIRIPDAHLYDFATLIHLHSALVPSILNRHQGALQHLDLSLWTVTVPMGKAISALPALRSLSVKLVQDLRIRKLSGKCIDPQRDAWQVLTQHAAWSGRLRSLKIENMDILMSHLAPLLLYNHSCRELRIRHCESLGQDLWAFLETGWKGRAALKILEIADCGSLLTEAALKSMETMRELKV